MRNIYHFKICKLIERTVAYEGNTVGYSHLLQALGYVGRVRLICARTEDIAEPSDLLVLKGRADEGYGDFGKLIAILKSTDTDNKLLLVSVRNGKAGDFNSSERIVADINQVVGQNKLGNARIGKGVAIDSFQCLGVLYGQLGQSRAAVESKVGYLNDRTRKLDIRQLIVAVERAFVDS